MAGVYNIKVSFVLPTRNITDSNNENSKKKNYML